MYIEVAKLNPWDIHKMFSPPMPPTQKHTHVKHPSRIPSYPFESNSEILPFLDNHCGFVSYLHIFLLSTQKLRLDQVPQMPSIIDLKILGLSCILFSRAWLSRKVEHTLRSSRRKSSRMRSLSVLERFVDHSLNIFDNGCTVDISEDSGKLKRC